MGESNPTLPWPCFKRDCGGPTLLSCGHVSSMSVENGNVIIRYKKKLAELITKVLAGETPLSRGHVSSMTRAGNRTVLSRGHVSSMTGVCTYPMYYQRVVNVENGTLLCTSRTSVQCLPSGKLCLKQLYTASACLWRMHYIP
jgi:hypothetical protein